MLACRELADREINGAELNWAVWARETIPQLAKPGYKPQVPLSKTQNACVKLQLPYSAQCHTASLWLQRKVIKNRKCISPRPNLHIQFLQVVTRTTVILYPCTKNKLTSLCVRCTDVNTFSKKMHKHIMNVRINTCHRSMKMFSGWWGQWWQQKWGRHVSTWVSHPVADPHSTHTTQQPLALLLHYGEAPKHQGREMLMVCCPVTKLLPGVVCVSNMYNY